MRRIGGPAIALLLGSFALLARGGEPPDGPPQDRAAQQAAGPAEDWVAALSDPDPERRQSAREEILRDRAAAVPLLLRALASPQVEARRFAVDVLPRLLRQGSPSDRIQLIRRIAAEGPAASTMGSFLDEIARGGSGEVMYAARAASMIVGSHVRFLYSCAEGAAFGRAGALEALEATRPEEAKLLFWIVQSQRNPDSPGELRAYFEAVARRTGEAPVILAAGLRKAKLIPLESWCRLLALQRELPEVVADAIVVRLTSEEHAPARHITRALLAIESTDSSDSLERTGADPLPPALRALAEARFASAPRATGFHYAVMVARDGESKVLTTAAREDAVLAALLPMSHERRTNLMSTMLPDERSLALGAMLSIGSANLAAPLGWFLRHGTEGEQEQVLMALANLPPIRPCLDVLADTYGQGRLAGDVRRVEIARSWDPDLSDPRALALFLRGLRDERSEMRAAALFRCEALWRIPPEVGACMEALLWNVGARPSLYYALNKCARMGSRARALTPLLLRVLAEDPPPAAGFRPTDLIEWRRLALRVLIQVELGSDASIPGLMAALRSSDTAQREAALGGLELLSALSAEQEEAVRLLIHDPEESVRKAAERLLRKSASS